MGRWAGVKLLESGGRTWVREGDVAFGEREEERYNENMNLSIGGRKKGLERFLSIPYDAKSSQLQHI